MNNSKYIVYRRTNHSPKTAIVFNEVETHANIAAALKAEIVSAGFVDLSQDPGEEMGIFVRVYGKSESLGLQSMMGDEKLVRKTLGLSY